MAHEGVPHVLTVTKWARFKKHWMPPESWPLWGIIGAASVMCVGYTVRLFGMSPDVIWNPKKRGISRINDDYAEGERYYKHAGRVAPYVTRMEPGYYFAFMRLISGHGWVPPPLPIGILHRKTAMANHMDNVFEMPAEVADYFKSLKAGKGK